jgi:Short C-terminal domain
VREAQAEAIRFNLLAAQQTASPAAPAREDPAEALRTLASLHNEGLLTDEEYATKRAEIIARI